MDDVEVLRKAKKIEDIDNYMFAIRRNYDFHFLINGKSAEDPYYKLDALVWSCVFHEKVGADLSDPITASPVQAAERVQLRSADGCNELLACQRGNEAGKLLAACQQHWWESKALSQRQHVHEIRQLRERRNAHAIISV